MKYPYLPEGRTLLFVSVNNPFMTEAMYIRNTKSTDRNHPTGAVVVKSNEVLGGAANQTGFRHRKLIELHEKGWCIRKKLGVKSGTKYWLCPGCATYTQHGEVLAIADALARSGPDAVSGADLYLYGHWWCCKPCWDSMIATGIQNVYLVEGADTLFAKRK